VIEGGFANNFTQVIMDVSIYIGDVVKEEIANKLLSFSVDGVLVFQVSF
jgi:hypothetical protein